MPSDLTGPSSLLYGTCGARRVCIRAFQRDKDTGHSFGPFLFVQLSPLEALVVELRSTQLRNLTTGVTPGLSRMKGEGIHPSLGSQKSHHPTAYDTLICAIVSRKFRMTADKWNNILLCTGHSFYCIPLLSRLPSYRSHHHL